MLRYIGIGRKYIVLRPCCFTLLCGLSEYKCNIKILQGQETKILLISNQLGFIDDNSIKPDIFKI